MFNPSSALELAYVAVEEALRLESSYAEARFEAVWREEVRVSDGRLGVADASTERGLSVRVLHRGAWGFAAVAEPTRHDVGVIARRAVELARAAAILQERPVELSDQEASRGVYRTPNERDPMAVPLAEKLELLAEVDGVLRAPAQVAHAQAFFRARRRRGVFVSSEGSEIEQDLLVSGLGWEVGASDGEVYRVRSRLGWSELGQGWEIAEALPVRDLAAETAEEAIALLSAEPCPEGSTQLILGSASVARHLALGLAPLLELDRVIGLGPGGGRGTFLAPGDLGGRRLGSEHVHVHADAQRKGGAGTFGFDDEGVPAEGFDLLAGGRVAGFLSSRETAARVGLARAQGSARAESWSEPPRPASTNLVLRAGGGGDLEALIADTDRGVLMDEPRTFSCDPTGRTFVATCESGWLIERGKRTRRVVAPGYRGSTEAFWSSCDGVADASSWRLHGMRLGDRGLPVGVGASPARFRAVEVGARAPQLVEVPRGGPLPLARLAPLSAAGRGARRPAPSGRRTGRRRPRRDVK